MPGSLRIALWTLLAASAQAAGSCRKWPFQSRTHRTQHSVCASIAALWRSISACSTVKPQEQEIRCPTTKDLAQTRHFLTVKACRTKLSRVLVRKSFLSALSK